MTKNKLHLVTDCPAVLRNICKIYRENIPYIPEVMWWPRGSADSPGVANALSVHMEKVARSLLQKARAILLNHG